MIARRFSRIFSISAIAIVLTMIPGCGGGVSTSKTPTPSPATNCSIQVNAFDPPGPGGNNWNAFQNFILPNPAIHGVNLVVPWNSVETAQGQYDSGLAALDAQFTNYPGKTINLIFQPISYTNINNAPGGVNTMTPSYVFTQQWASSLTPPSPPLDVVTCNVFPGNGAPASGLPVVYEAPFKVAYQNFIRAVLQHYQGNSNIGYMRFGLASGNETFAFCTQEMQALPAPNTFTTQVWEDWVSSMETFEKSALPNPPIQLMQSLNHLDTTSYTALPDFEAQTAVMNGFGFGDNGLQSSDLANSAANLPCTGNWCALFDQYAGQVPLELQEANPSNPSGSDPGNPTGNLAQLIPLAAAHHATILELLMDDLYLAYDPNFTPKNPGDKSFSGAYQTAINNPCATGQ